MEDGILMLARIRRESGVTPARLVFLSVLLGLHLSGKKVNPEP